MPDMKVEGMDEFVRSLTAIGRHTAGVARKCAYDGAALLRGELEESVKALPLDTDGFTVGTDPLRVITERDRADLAACAGISKIESDGLGTSVSVSFDGYISRTEKDFPKGVPAALIARSIESGSSVRAKRPFMRMTVKNSSERVLSAMQETMTESIAQISKMEG